MLALSLFGCAQAPAQEVCKTTTADKLLLAMRGGGIEPAHNLQGAAAVSFRDWLETRGVRVPMKTDQALIFVNDVLSPRIGSSIDWRPATSRTPPDARRSIHETPALRS